MRPKLTNIWWLVLLRGFVDGALALPLFGMWPADLHSLTVLVAFVTLVGGVLELAMYGMMRGHRFQGILRLMGVADVLLGLGLYVIPGLIDYSVTPAFLLVLSGMWIATRGFAVLWLGLSIVNHPYIRIVSVLPGFAALAAGAAMMLFLPPTLNIIVYMICGYGIGSSLLHIVVALRMRIDRYRIKQEERRQRLAQEQAAQEGA